MLAINTVPHLHHMVNNHEITIRPMTPEDTKLEEDFVNNMSATSKYFRFMEGIGKLSPAMLQQLCNIDGKHAMAFIATIKDAGGEKQIGVSRYASGKLETDSELESEMALAVADEWHHKGIDQLLMQPLIEYAKNNGIERLYSFEFAENTAMKRIAKELGMTSKADPEDATLVTYSLAI